MYLNALYLGNGAYGIGAAAQRYFGKPISKLQMNEIAVIAGLYQSPSSYNPSRFQKEQRKDNVKSYGHSFKQVDYQKQRLNTGIRNLLNISLMQTKIYRLLHFL